MMRELFRLWRKSRAGVLGFAQTYEGAALDQSSAVTYPFFVTAKKADVSPPFCRPLLSICDMQLTFECRLQNGGKIHASPFRFGVEP